MMIKERIQALRHQMINAGVAAWIVPGTDPHMNEYLPEFWAEREFISGFTGSAGKVVITQTMAGLWTDGRYFIQATDQLQEGGLELFKEKVDGTPTITEFLCANIRPGDRVGINGLTMPVAMVQSLQNDLMAHSIALVSDLDLITPIWNDRPSLSDAPLFTLPVTTTGESTSSKLQRLRQSLGNADAAFFNMLDEIAWLYNVRGADVPCNPVVMSYAWVEKEFAILFVDETKVSPSDRTMMENTGISIFPYDSVFEMLPDLSADTKVVIDYSKVNYAIASAMPQAELINTPSWVTMQKARKNSIELEGTRRAMVKDGVALTQFFMWLEKAVVNQQPTEYEIGVQLGAFRAKQDEYVGESFAPIVGYESNGAIAHYSAPEQGSKVVEPRGILLLDSGGQYMHGTTDITRTVAVGEVSSDMKEDFTLVLKGHINLGSVKFPKGTRGAQLDALARVALWSKGKDYQHGTGHGVGHFLNVHEGPQNIRKDDNKTELVPGMLLSNEPGFYLEGQYGIRIENLVSVQAFDDGFLAFENMTLFPIDKKLIDVTLLLPNEKEWLNDYHQSVYEKLSPLLSSEENEWLRDKTLPILA